MDDAYSWITDEYRNLADAHAVRIRRVVRPLPGAWCEIDGRRARNFSGNDYLGLAGDDRLTAAAQRALEACGSGARASALVCGRTHWHEQLEARLAAFEGAEAALLFPTGYAANVGTITALVGRDDLVLSDRLNHASLIDGCRLSRAQIRVYAHGDVEQVDRELEKHRDARRKLIVTDGLFSMDGDLAPLQELANIARRQSAMLLVDEAHATGVLGANGRGTCELAGVEQEAVRVGTLSKALGAQGGFVTGSRELIDWLWNTARTQIFSTALAPACCAAACAALEIVDQEPERRVALQARSDELRRALIDRGVTPLAGSSGPIVPVVLHDSARTMAVGRALEEQGFLVGAIRPPTVPRDSARLRISLSAVHSAEDVRGLAAAIVAAIESASR